MAQVGRHLNTRTTHRVVLREQGHTKRAVALPEIILFEDIVIDHVLVVDVLTRDPWLCQVDEGLQDQVYD